MAGRLCIYLLAALIQSNVTLGNSVEFSPKVHSHIEVTMRMIGHQVLLSAGDSSSIVLPIQKRGDQYRILFEADFGFDPDNVSMRIDSIMRSTDISENYIVEFVRCDTKSVIHSYEIGEKADVLACQGRAQGESCYEIWITLLDTISEEKAAVERELLSDSKNSSNEMTSLNIPMALAVIFLIAFIVYLIRRYTSPIPDPDIVHIGAFQFNKKNMELSMADARIELTGKEADLLQLLATSVNKTVEREDILKNVWGDDGDYVGRTLDVFISKLRKKLQADSNVKIINIRGIGYRLITNQQRGL